MASFERQRQCAPAKGRFPGAISNPAVSLAIFSRLWNSIDSRLGEPFGLAESSFSKQLKQSDEPARPAVTQGNDQRANQSAGRWFVAQTLLASGIPNCCGDALGCTTEGQKTCNTRGRSWKRTERSGHRAIPLPDKTVSRSLRVPCRSVQLPSIPGQRWPLHSFAYTLVNLFRLHLPQSLRSAEIETLRMQLFKIGAQVRQTARCVGVQDEQVSDSKEQVSQ